MASSKSAQWYRVLRRTPRHGMPPPASWMVLGGLGAAALSAFLLGVSSEEWAVFGASLGGFVEPLIYSGSGLVAVWWICRAFGRPDDQAPAS